MSEGQPTPAQILPPLTFRGALLILDGGGVLGGLSGGLARCAETFLEHGDISITPLQSVSIGAAVGIGLGLLVVGISALEQISPTPPSDHPGSGDVPPYGGW